MNKTKFLQRFNKAFDNQEIDRAYITTKNNIEFYIATFENHIYVIDYGILLGTEPLKIRHFLRLSKKPYKNYTIPELMAFMCRNWNKINAFMNLIAFNNIDKYLEDFMEWHENYVGTGENDRTISKKLYKNINEFVLENPEFIGFDNDIIQAAMNEVNEYILE